MMEQLKTIWDSLLKGEHLAYGLPEDISTHGFAIDRLIVALHWFMLLLFVGWGLYLLYCLVKFRSRPGHNADVSPKHFTLPKFLEIGVVVFEAVLLIFFSYPIWAQYKTQFPPENEALVVHVYAEQFAWNIHYPGRDGKFGKRDIKLVDGTNPIGLDREDPDAKDDIVTINELNVPVNKPVIADITSKDVIHSFFLPVARVKQDAIPGMVFRVSFTLTQTGNSDIACAQLCGIGHYRMRGALASLSAEDFAAWQKREEDALNGIETPAAETPAAETPAATESH